MATTRARERASSNRAVLRLAGAQGIFYAVTGLWPLVSMRTFEAVTGRKREHWLVKTTGLLIAVMGGTLVLARRQGRIPPEIAFLGGAGAASLGTIALYYGARGRISRIYLLDAAVELSLATAWIALGPRAAREMV